MSFSVSSSQRVQIGQECCIQPQRDAALARRFSIEIAIFRDSRLSCASTVPLPHSAGHHDITPGIIIAQLTAGDVTCVDD